MALKRPSTLLSLPSTVRANVCLQCRRHLHARLTSQTPIPKPTPFVPDVQTFLTLIGRNLSQHAAKIPTWEALFSLTGQQLRESGVEPARARRYLLWWRERFRNGIKGIGGDLQFVENGTGELRIVEVPSERGMDKMATLTRSAGMRKVIVNTPPSISAEEKDGDAAETTTAPSPQLEDTRDAKPVSGFKIVNNTVIGGRGVRFIKGHQGVAQLKVQEGLWEQRRGHKVDGGERRKAEVRAKRRVQERKNAKR